MEDFAGAIQKDLARMATKDGLEQLATKKDLERFATKEDLTTGLSDVSDKIAVAKENLQDQIAGLRYAKEIDELRERVNTLEGKVGIKPARAA